MINNAAIPSMKILMIVVKVDSKMYFFRYGEFMITLSRLCGGQAKAQ